MTSIVVAVWLLAFAGGIFTSNVTEFSRKNVATDIHRTTCSLNGSRYYIQFFFKANWHRANQYCRYNGMNLASINSAEDQFTLEKQITELGLRNERFWLSGNDLLMEGQFSWASNGRPFHFERWWFGQPDNAGGVEDCVELWDFKWNDNQCKVEFFFACEE